MGLPNRIPLPTPTQAPPSEPVPVPVEAENLESSVKIGTVAQVVIALIALIGLIYLLKLVLITTFVSILIAYMLEPFVSWLKRVGVPRGVGAMLAVVLALALTGLLFYFAYNRAVDFSNHMPQYITQIHEVIQKWTSHATQIAEQSRAAIEGPTADKPPVTVRVQDTSGISKFFESTGPIVETLLAVGFIPFLVYFMLSWKEHFQQATLWLFPREHRSKARATVGTISVMIRSYLVANFLIGLVSSAILMLIFGLLHIQYFYFLGVISGFVSLIPYLGLFLALLPPLAGGLGTLDRSGLLVIVIAVTALHFIAVNVIYPRFVGKRLELNPVVVSLSLLFWSWIWGAMGLILAIPLLGSAKIICDHVNSLNAFGAWLGESGDPK